MIYLEDNVLSHSKMVMAGDDGVMMWLRGLTWLKEQKSPDGRIPKAVVLARMAPIFGGKALNPAPIMKRLVEVGCWHDDGDHVVVHGYVERNEAAIQRTEIAKTKAHKRWAKEKERRAEAAEKGAVAPARAKPQQMPEQSRGNAAADAGGNAGGRCNSPQRTDTEPPSLPSPHRNGIADPAEGGSGYAEEPPPPDPGGDEPAAGELSSPPTTTDADPVRSGLARIDRTLRDTCPPAMDRVYGQRRDELRDLLRGGADVELAVCAIRQGATNDGAPIRADRAIAALRTGKQSGPSGHVPPRIDPKQVDRERAEQEAVLDDPAAFTSGLAEARKALGR